MNSVRIISQVNNTYSGNNPPIQFREKDLSCAADKISLPCTGCPD